MVKSAMLWPFQPQVSVEGISGHGSSGNAGERLLERVFRVLRLLSPYERKVRDASFRRAMNDIVCGMFRLLFSFRRLKRYPILVRGRHLCSRSNPARSERCPTLQFALQYHDSTNES